MKFEGQPESSRAGHRLRRAVTVFLAVLAAAPVALVVLPAQDPADSSPAAQVLRRLSETYGKTNGPRDPRLLRPLTSQQLVELLHQDNGFLKAAAIGELRNRNDRGPGEEIRKLFRETPLHPRELVFDPHAQPSPNLSIVLAAGEYTAAVALRSPQAVDELLSRTDVWRAPFWFVPAFRAMSAGWMTRVADLAVAPKQQAAAATWIRDGATVANAEELAALLRAHTGPVWRGAASGCARIDAEPCWAAIDESQQRQVVYDRLLARDLQSRKGRASNEVWLDAALTAARALRVDPDPDSRLAGSLELIEFLAHAAHRGVQLPLPLRESLTSIHSASIDQTLREAVQR